MCFVHDYDWCASVEVVLGTRGSAGRCIDCGRRIAPDEWRLHVYQQEYEECQACEWEDVPACEDGEHDYGETFACDICRECCEWREAIRSAEIDAGCHEDESQPAYGELLDAIYWDCTGRYAWAHYWRRAS